MKKLILQPEFMLLLKEHLVNKFGSLIVVDEERLARKSELLTIMAAIPDKNGKVPPLHHLDHVTISLDEVSSVYGSLSTRIGGVATEYHGVLGGRFDGSVNVKTYQISTELDVWCSVSSSAQSLDDVEALSKSASLIAKVWRDAQSFTDEMASSHDFYSRNVYSWNKKRLSVNVKNKTRGRHEYVVNIRADKCKITDIRDVVESIIANDRNASRQTWASEDVDRFIDACHDETTFERKYRRDDFVRKAQILASILSNTLYSIEYPQLSSIDWQNMVNDGRATYTRNHR